MYRTPDLFVQNLKKHKIINALRNYDYSAIVTLDHSEPLTRFARFAYHLTALNFEAARDIIQTLTKENTDEKRHFINFESKVNHLIRDKNERIKHLYIMSKIRCHQGAFDDFLIKMFTINEQILLPYVEEVLGQNYRSRNWKSSIERNAALVTYLRSQRHNGRRFRYETPKISVYHAIYNFKYEGQDPEFDELCDYLKYLSKLRNKVAHDITGIDKNIIEQKVQQSSYSLASLERVIHLADQYFNVNGCGIFDEINKFILNYFLKNANNIM